MSGIAGLNRKAFADAAGNLRAMGYEPINPHDLPHTSTEWHDCMRLDIKALCDCDGIVMLPGWIRSRGARIERALAWVLGIARVTGVQP
jgi:hypothetical protein